jgi:osmoprotectant transport system permease protein
MGVGGCEPATLTVGSKNFTESFVLGEVAVRALSRAGVRARHRAGMGGTIILWQALRSGSIDVYPDYTGTIAQQILRASEPISTEAMRDSLAAQGIGMMDPLGFENTYALVMRRDEAEARGVRRISDLRDHPDLRVGLTHEFLERRDGWRPLAEHYGLNIREVRGLDHSLAYPALARGDLDLMDAYSTDAKLGELDLVTLSDDRSYFPSYAAVFLYRLGVDVGDLEALEALAGSFDEGAMIRLNAAAEASGDYGLAARQFFGEEGSEPEERGTVALRILGWTIRHLELVAVSLFLAILIGVPLGIRAARPGWFSRVLLGTVGVIYTVPSLALLAVLVAVPFLGIATRTAIVALFLYSLLPIVRNTAAGLQAVPPQIRESARALGLEARDQLWKVYLPMASPTILAGIKTSAVINIATATLAALIGVGGLGEPILSGINLNDGGVILQGALPAAALAIGIQGLFDVLERWVVPKGLRLRTEHR